MKQDNQNEKTIRTIGDIIEMEAAEKCMTTDVKGELYHYLKKNGFSTKKLQVRIGNITKKKDI